MELFGNISGLIAALCVGFFMVPQCIKTYKRKKVDDLSGYMVTIGVVGDIFAIIHMITVLPFTWMLTMRYALVSLCGLVLFIMYLKYRK